MQRYFIPENHWEEKNVYITGGDAHHIIRVMRNSTGDGIICNHPDGSVAECKIERITQEQVVAQIIKWIEESVELPVHITIVQGLPKGDKLELTLQKGTELGATAFIPYTADRSIVHWDAKKKEKKQQRFSKIVKEASEQSHRNKVPEVHPVMPLKEVIPFVEGYDVKIFAHAEQAKAKDFHSLAHILKGTCEHAKIVICIGPEGGFSESEVALLKKHQFTSIRLGPRILRTETAALYALSSISYHFEELRWHSCQQ